MWNLEHINIASQFLSATDSLHNKQLAISMLFCSHSAAIIKLFYSNGYFSNENKLFTKQIVHKC